MQPNRLLNILSVIFLVCTLVSAGFAFEYRRERDEYKLQLDEQTDQIDQALESSKESVSRGERETAASEDEPTSTSDKPTSRPTGSRRVFELLDLLAQKDVTIGELRQEITDLEKKTPGRRERMAERMAERVKTMKEQDPERLEKTQQAFTALPDTISKGFGEQAKFFGTIDVSELGQEEQERHVELQKYLADMQEMLTQIREDPEAVSAREARWEIFQELP